MAEATAVEALASEELERGTRPYASLYDHWERHQWSALALDFTTDARSFQALGPEDQEALTWLFAHRFHAEFNVARLLAPFLLTAPSWEVQLLLATQTADEHRHLKAVLRVYEEVFGIRGGFAAVQELADRHLDDAADALYRRLDHHIATLDAERDEDTFLAAVVVYHLLAEGVIARTAQNLSGPTYERLGDFPGLAHGQRLVARDEARHIGIGVSYCRERMSSDPERTRAVVGEVIEEFGGVATTLLERTGERLADLARAGYGVEPEGFYAEAMRLLELRLRAIGYAG